MPAIFAIDPSLSNTAMCWMRDDTHHIVRCVSAKATGTSWEHRTQRYLTYCNELAALSEAVGVPEYVFFEGYSFGSKGRAVSAMYELGVMLRGMADTIVSSANIIEVSPSTVKQFATGKGNANKTAVVASITKRYGVEFKTDDEYDAFALAQLGACALGWTEPSTDAQRKAVAVVRALIAASQVAST